MPFIKAALNQLPSRHLLPVVVFGSLSLTVIAQSQQPEIDPALSMPNSTDVSRVVIEPGGISVYTPESLLKLLPHFIRTQGLFLARKFPQKGTIELKNGKVLHWMAWDKYSIELHSGKRWQFFVVPAECGFSREGKGITLSAAGARAFNHTGRIILSRGSAVVLEYMPLEDALERPNAPGLSAEFECVEGRAASVLSLKFWSTRRLKGYTLAVIADGRVLKQTILRSPTDAMLEDLGLIIYTVVVPRRLFSKIVEAQTLKLLAGKKTFTLRANHLEALRDLASRMER